MNKKYIVRLGKEERAQLLAMIRVGKAAAHKLLWARILLKVDQAEGRAWLSDEEAAEALETSRRTVERVRRRLVEEGMEAALTRKKRETPPRHDYEYERNGTCNLFVFCEPLTGWRHVKVTERKTKQDWAHAIRDLVDVHFPDAEKIVLVMDNLNTHSPASLYAAFAPEEARRLTERLEIHFTPKHGSWLDMAEIMIGNVSRDGS